MILGERTWVIEHEQSFYTRLEQFTLDGESRVVWLRGLAGDHSTRFPDNQAEKVKQLEEQFQREILQPEIASQCKSCKALAAMFGPTGHCSSYRVVCDEDNDDE